MQREKSKKNGKQGGMAFTQNSSSRSSASERTIKANHVLISCPSNTLDVYSSERDQVFVWKQLVACCLQLWKLHWARIQDSSADGTGMRCCIFCKNQHCRSGLFFELLGSQPRVHGYVLWQLWYSVLSPGCPVRAPPITSSSVQNGWVHASWGTDKKHVRSGLICHHCTLGQVLKFHGMRSHQMQSPDNLEKSFSKDTQDTMSAACQSHRLTVNDQSTHGNSGGLSGTSMWMAPSAGKDKLL